MAAHDVRETTQDDVAASVPSRTNNRQPIVRVIVQFEDAAWEAEVDLDGVIDAGQMRDAIRGAFEDTLSARGQGWWNMLRSTERRTSGLYKELSDWCNGARDKWAS